MMSSPAGRCYSLPPNQHNNLQNSPKPIPQSTRVKSISVYHISYHITTPHLRRLDTHHQDYKIYSKLSPRIYASVS